MERGSARKSYRRDGGRWRACRLMRLSWIAARTQAAPPAVSRSSRWAKLPTSARSALPAPRMARQQIRRNARRAGRSSAARTCRSRRSAFSLRFCTRWRISHSSRWPEHKQSRLASRKRIAVSMASDGAELRAPPPVGASRRRAGRSSDARLKRSWVETIEDQTPTGRRIHTGTQRQTVLVPTIVESGR